MTLAALCDVSESVRNGLVKSFEGVSVFASHTQLIESGLVDAVIIATPHYFHPPIAIDAFRAGLHVLTEKPAGVDCASVKQMIAEAQRSKKRFGVMFNQRASKLFEEAKRIMESGELGELRRMVWIVTNWYRKQEYYDSGAWRATWAGEGGGVLLNQAPHNLDIWQWLCGMPIQLRAECEVAKYHRIEVEDEATLFARYENGATAVFITSTGDYPGTNRLEITGSLGKLVLEGGVLKHYRLEMDESEYRFSDKSVGNAVSVVEIQDEKRECHVAILQNFADCVQSGERLLAEGADALFELEISNAAYLSAWQNATVTLPVCDAQFIRELEKRKQASRNGSCNGITESNGEYFSRWNTNW